MRYHAVPIQLNEDERIIGGKLTLRQIGFLAAALILILGIIFFLSFLPWYLLLIPIGLVVYQTVKFTFFTRFGWDYYVYWLKLRRCKKRRATYAYRKRRGA